MAGGGILIYTAWVSASNIVTARLQRLYVAENGPAQAPFASTCYSSILRTVQMLG